MATSKKYFRTPVSEPKTVVTPAGSKIEDVWDMKLDEKGNEIFYISGQTNVYEKIQAQVPETDIEEIIRRCTETGDFTVLEAQKGSYMDMTGMPTSYFEAANRINKAEEAFKALPLNIKEKYDNNFMKYLADIGTDNWKEIMGIVSPAQPEIKEETKEETKE